jgi:pimeloyl-ACP methyl ester carboxylesterase
MRAIRISAAIGAAAISIGLLVATDGSTSAAPRIATDKITWAKCTTGLEAQLGFECGMLSVPLDYAKPASGYVSIAVSRRKHTSTTAAYQGVMIMNPGGPGGAGKWLPMMADFFPADVAAAYDWIGYDPRGIGDSVPALSCDSTYLNPNRPAYVPGTIKLENSWRARAQGYAASCAKKGGTLLSHMGTLENVRDIESLRVALKQDTINFYGYSYGTYLGQVYATMYPNQVRRMVLDSNVGASSVWQQSNLDQNQAFEKVMTKFFAWMAKYDSVYHLGKTEAAVEATWYKTLDKLAVKPAGGAIGPSEMTDIFLNAGYLQMFWPELATDLAGWVNKAKFAPLVEWYGSGGDDNSYAAYLSTICADAPWSRTWSNWKSETVKSQTSAPYATWGNAWYNAPCATWPVAARPRLSVGTSAGPAILLLDETLDGATPYAGSLETRQLFPNSRLIATVGGTSHASSPSGLPCVDDQISAYLRSGTIVARKPGLAADSSCAALPPGIPDEVVATVKPAQVVTAQVTVSDTLERAALWRLTWRG